jgi:predicted NBD/HSP70 family sugar kinase
MLIGIDWGGTKIEGVALTEEGRVALEEKLTQPLRSFVFTQL